MAQGRSAVSSLLVTALRFERERELRTFINASVSRIKTPVWSWPAPEIQNGCATGAHKSYLPSAAEMTGVGPDVDDLDPLARDEEGPRRE